MYLEDWGSDAMSRVTGTPMNFYVWIASQIGEALMEEAKQLLHQHRIEKLPIIDKEGHLTPYS